MLRIALWLLCLFPADAAILIDISGVRPGPISARGVADGLIVSWADEKGASWAIEFRADGNPQVLRRISVGGKSVIENAQPVYFADTGIRRGGWDQFFDFPPSHPAGIRRFQQEFKPTSVAARTVGNRLEVTFAGMRVGVFSGSVVYTVYPGSRLIKQEAVLSTAEDNVAYFYDAGIDYQPAEDRRPGNNMETEVTSYSPEDSSLRTFRVPLVSERNPETVKYRALAAKTAGGSLAVFPPPHQFLRPRLHLKYGLYVGARLARPCGARHQTIGGR